MKRVLVIGSPGSGKSTFSRKLSEKTGLPLYYLDMLWHKPDKTNVSEEEFDEKLSLVLSLDSWIIDGNYTRTLEWRLEHCDTVFLMDIPVELCLEGASSRIGKKRVDMPWVEEDFDPEFREYIVNFGVNTLPKMQVTLDKFRDRVEIITFNSREKADEYLNRI